MLAKTALSIAALAALVHSQTAPCEARNDSNTNVSTSLTASPFVGLNPSSRAYQFSPQSTVTVESAAVFSGSPNRDDFYRLEIWDNDAAQNEPANRLAVGTGFSPMSATASWLGTNFDAAVTLNAGTNYWFVMIEPGAFILPEEPGGTPLPRRTRATTNPWGSLGSGEIKFRLFCNLLDRQNVAAFGPPTTSSVGQLPTVFTNDDPVAGANDFRLQGTNLRPGATVVLVIGVNPTWPSAPLGSLFPPGAALNTDIAASVFSATGVAEIGDQPTTPRPSPFGHVVFNIPLANVGSGAFFSAQLFGLDTGFSVAIPVIGTNALRVTTL